MIPVISLAALAALVPVALAGPKGIDPNHIPYKTEGKQQFGYNACGTTDSPSSKCQTLWLNDLQDFCLFGPPVVKSVGDAEAETVAYCTKPGHGSRLLPPGSIKGAHIVFTKYYMQITGVGDFTKINIPKGDEGGELDPHGATDIGNPVGGLVFAKTPQGQVVQAEEWTQYIDYNSFGLRACYKTTRASSMCNHIYDEMGAEWNIPASYSKGVFETCDGDFPYPAMGRYRLANGTTSTWYQGISPTPSAHPIPKSSNCVRQATVTGATYAKSSPKPAPKPAKPVPAKGSGKGTSKGKGKGKATKPGKVVTKPKPKKSSTKPKPKPKKSSSKAKPKPKKSVNPPKGHTKTGKGH